MAGSVNLAPSFSLNACFMPAAVTPSLSTLLTQVDAAIIDLDGTMVDTMGDFNEALNRMLRELELPSIAAQTI